MQPFAAVKFNTANEQRKSACAVAVIRFNSDGDIDDGITGFLRPHESVDYFNPINTWMHGITAKHVVDAPQWPEMEGRVREVVGDLPIVAHSMAFDGYVLSDLTELYGSQPFTNRRFCTVRLARRLLSDMLETRRLTDVFGYYFPDQLPFEHDDLLDHAQACGQIFARMQQEYSWETLEEMCPPTGPHARRQRKPHSSKQVKASSDELIALYGESDALEGERVAFTGTLERAQRAEAQNLVVAVGGVAEKSLTKKTTILVVGTPNPRSWSPGASASRKLNTAQKMREAGSPIEVLTEEEFFNRLLD